MATFNKLDGFTKKVVDLADVPSETMTPADIKAWFDSSPEELRTTLNAVVDNLNNNAANWTVKTGNHAGTWQNLTPAAIGAEGMNASRIDLLEKRTKDSVSIIEVGAVGDYDPVAGTGTDNTAVIQDLLNTANGKTIVIPSGKFLVKGLTLNDGQQLFVFGDLYYSSDQSGSMISGNTLDGVGIYGFGGSLNGNQNDVSSAVTLLSFTNSIIKGLRIKGFLNKGISLSNCDGVIVTENNISGASGTTGAGISAFGASCFRCTISNNIIDGNRIGIAVNGGGYHTINSNTCDSNSLAGIMLDGVVTGSGDGTKHSTVKGNVIANCTNANFGGIYLGNGCSYNNVSGNVSTNNARSGIRLSSGSTNQQYGNVIANNVTKNNAGSGVELSYSYQTIIAGNSIYNNSQKGIAGTYSDNSKIHGNIIRGNVQQGILWQCGNSSINDNQITGNDKGIELAYGGSAPNGNTVSSNDLAGNTTGNLVIVDINKIENNTGFVSENRGIASSIASGGTIPHGLAGNPSASPYGHVSVQAKGTSNAGPSNIRVNADATNITIYYQGTGPFDFYWSATLGTVV